jgi:hypothetical protein
MIIFRTLSKYLALSVVYNITRTTYYVNGPLYKKEECNNDRITHVIFGIIQAPFTLPTNLIIDYVNITRYLKKEKIDYW